MGIVDQRLHRAKPSAGRGAAGLAFLAVHRSLLSTHRAWTYHWPDMPVRATKRGADRPRLQRDCDVLICGASFAGLAVARELAGSGARVLMLDRYEIGERQTSACAMPTSWLHALDLHDSLLQSFDELVVHTPFRRGRWSLPWTFSTFDYRELCALLYAQAHQARPHKS